MKNAPDAMTRAPTCFCAAVSKAASTSLGVAASSTTSCTPSARRIFCDGDGRLEFRVFRISQQRHHRRGRNDFVKQRHSFRYALDVEPADAGHVAAWPIEAGDEAGLYRIFAAVKDDRYRGGRRHGETRRHNAAGCGNNIDLATNQFGGEHRQLVRIAARPAILDDDVLPLDIARLAQAVAKHLPIRRVPLGRLTAEEADDRHCRLLRARGPWQYGRSTNHTDEIAPPHLPPPTKDHQFETDP